MKSKSELSETIAKIVDPNSPVGMDAVYVHALILDKLESMEGRLAALEARLDLTAATRASTGVAQSEQAD